MADPPVLQPSGDANQPALRLNQLGPIAIIAPHPDDETLGCGGLMALCGQWGVPLTVLAMTDGDASHPGSMRTTPEQLVALRAEERSQAMTVLGVSHAQVERLHLPDGRMHELDAVSRERCVRRIVSVLGRDRIQTLFVTASTDEHADHRASHALVQRALQRIRPMRTLTYEVWPPEGQVAAGEHWSLDIQTVREQKRRAIACFVSQCGGMIADDPAGFVMPESLLARALAARELYYPGPT